MKKSGVVVFVIIVLLISFSFVSAADGVSAVSDEEEKGGFLNALKSFFSFKWLNVFQGVVVPPPVRFVCGDGACNPGEDHYSCPGDCPNNLPEPPKPSRCGDGSCVPPETFATCPIDCSRGCEHVSDCDDRNPCTTDSCMSGVCEHFPIPGCGGCPQGCDDRNPCTTDSCMSGVCEHFPIPGCNVECPGGCGNCQTCIAGVCVPDNTLPGCGVNCPQGCNDNNACTTDTCVNGVCNYFPIPGCAGNCPQGCNDNNACTTDTCVNGICQYTNVNCFDNNCCTNDVCNPKTGCKNTQKCESPYVCDRCKCKGGSGCTSPSDCDDGNSCTMNYCRADGTCSPSYPLCPDLNKCNPRTCIGGACIASTVNCDDSNLCTSDSCDPLIGCRNIPLNCDDSNLCTTDICNPSTGCAFTPKSCNDNDPCTTDSCDPKKGCVYVVAAGCGKECGQFASSSILKFFGLSSGSSECDDNNLCTEDSCSDGKCVHKSKNCDDNDPCTDDSCDSAGCVNTLKLDCKECGGAITLKPIKIWEFFGTIEGKDTEKDTCDDGNVCNGKEYCGSNNKCQPGNRLNCDDGDACTTDNCNPSTGCAFTPRNCDDKNACTVDNCDSATGVCMFSPKVCNDGKTCTTDSCDTLSGCVFTLKPDCKECEPTTTSANPFKTILVSLGITKEKDPCDDGDACTTDSCGSDGKCVHKPKSCDDSDACTLDICNPSTGCAFTPRNCDDGNACTINSCDTVSGCIKKPKDCSDFDSGCSEGICDNSNGNCYGKFINEGQPCTPNTGTSTPSLFFGLFENNQLLKTTEAASEPYYCYKGTCTKRCAGDPDCPKDYWGNFVCMPSKQGDKYDVYRYFHDWYCYDPQGFARCDKKVLGPFLYKDCASKGLTCNFDDPSQCVECNVYSDCEPKKFKWICKNDPKDGPFVYEPLMKRRCDTSSHKCYDDYKTGRVLKYCDEDFAEQGGKDTCDDWKVYCKNSDQDIWRERYCYHDYCTYRKPPDEWAGWAACASVRALFQEKDTDCEKFCINDGSPRCIECKQDPDCSGCLGCDEGATYNCVKNSDKDGKSCKTEDGKDGKCKDGICGAKCDNDEDCSGCLGCDPKEKTCKEISNSKDGRNCKTEDGKDGKCKDGICSAKCDNDEDCSRCLGCDPKTKECVKNSNKNDKSCETQPGSGIKDGFCKDGNCVKCRGKEDCGECEKCDNEGSNPTNTCVPDRDKDSNGCKKKDGSLGFCWIGKCKDCRDEKDCSGCLGCDSNKDCKEISSSKDEKSCKTKDGKDGKCKDGICEPLKETCESVFGVNKFIPCGGSPANLKCCEEGKEMCCHDQACCNIQQETCERALLVGIVYCNPKPEKCPPNSPIFCPGKSKNTCCPLGSICITANLGNVADCGKANCKPEDECPLGGGFFKGGSLCCDDPNEVCGSNPGETYYYCQATGNKPGYSKCPGTETYTWRVIWCKDGVEICFPHPIGYPRCVSSGIAQGKTSQTSSTSAYLIREKESFVLDGTAYIIEPYLEFKIPISITMDYSKFSDESIIETYKFQDHNAVLDSCKHTLIKEVSKIINAEGGIINLNQITADIPKGALASQTNVKITEYLLNECYIIGDDKEFIAESSSDIPLDIPEIETLIFSSDEIAKGEKTELFQTEYLETGINFIGKNEKPIIIIVLAGLIIAVYLLTRKYFNKKFSL